MRTRHAAVSLGSIRAVSLDTGAAIVTDVWFPAGSALPTHMHERTIFGVMLDGAFDSVIAKRRLDCRLETAWTEPRGEPHANHIGAGGARVLAIQPDPLREDLYAPLAEMLDGVQLVQTAGLRADALRLARELREPDTLRNLAIESLVMLLMVSAARLRFSHQHHGHVPAWLVRARDALHAQFASPPGLTELAAIAGVSPSHLAHSFRKYFQLTPGAYVRQVRASWATQQLADTDRPLSDIALRAGYCDQSHFNRELRRVLGVTPQSYRASLRQ